ncbi:MAG TPA: hypothetical protein VJM11_09645 [Nevskiaceae bacterium]|nr:hypothetical protein [Nevskiaceae bacterium]
MGIKMRRALAFVLVAGISSTAFAADSGLTFRGRVGPSVGTYSGAVDVTVRDADTGTVLLEFSDGSDRRFAGGLQLGMNAAVAGFSADLALDYMRLEFQDEDVDRTDVLLTLGYQFLRHFSIFGGYRRGWQGDEVFNDDIFEESGPFVGVGVGGMELGPLYLYLSAARNYSEVVDFLGEEDFEGDMDYNGVSLKATFVPIQAPRHSVQLRYQKFHGDRTFSGGDLEAEVDLTERYLQLFYLYSFGG